MPSLSSPILRTILLLACSNVFMMFARFYMKQPLKLDYLYSALCVLGALFFMFRSTASAA